MAMILFSVMNKRLDFLVVGVQKSATTTLDQYLRMHPLIDMPSKKKELHFFDKPEYYSQGFEYYHSFFSNARYQSKWGECTPIYCYWPESIEKIYAYNSKIKLILLLRNPIDRAYSHWNMEFTHKRETLSFYDALVREESRLKIEPKNKHRVYSYIDRGKYTEQIKHIWDVFGEDNLLIVKMDDLIALPAQTINLIYNFIGVPNREVQESIQLYKGKYLRKKISKKEEELLISIFQKEIKALEKLLTWDCSDWLIY